MEDIFNQRRRKEIFVFILSLDNYGPISFIGGIQDLRSIGLVCKCLVSYCHDSRKVTRLMDCNLDCVLERFGFCSWNFIALLGETHSIIAGSAILQCARGDIFVQDKGSDIDIYVPMVEETTVFEYLMDNNYGRMSRDEDLIDSVEHLDPEVEYMMNDTLDQQLGGGGYTSSNISHVVNCYHACSGLKVDLVVMNENISPRCAIGSYDFTFLMALYDGRFFELWFPIDIMERHGRYNTVS